MYEKQNLRLIVFILLFLFLFNTIGCAPKEEGIYITQNCSVTKYDSTAVISCPDGTEITLEPELVVDSQPDTYVTIELTQIKNCKNNRK